MARGRMLNRSVCLSLKYDQLPDDSCRLLATWILSHLDHRGVFCADSEVVKSLVLPRRADVSVEQVDHYLNAMREVGLIEIFEHDGQRWQVWPGFDHNQVGLRHDRESSDYPDPDLCRQVSGSLPATTGDDAAEGEEEVEVKHESKDSPSPAQNALDLLVGITGSRPNAAARTAVTRLAARPDFELDRWRASIDSCLLAGVKATNTACFIDSYQAGGDYQTLQKERKRKTSHGTRKRSSQPAHAASGPHRPESTLTPEHRRLLGIETGL